MRNVFFNTPELETTFQLCLAIQGQQEPQESSAGNSVRHNKIVSLRHHIDNVFT